MRDGLAPPRRRQRVQRLHHHFDPIRLVPVAAHNAKRSGPPLSTSELLDKQPERRRLTVVFVCGPLREFFGTTAYSLGVAVALPMLKGVGLTASGHWKAVHNGFLLPTRVVMAVFRGKMLAAIRQAWAHGALVLPDGLRPQQLMHLLL